MPVQTFRYKSTTITSLCYFISTSCNEHDETADLRRIHNEEFHNLHFSPKIIRVIKSRIMGLFGQVARNWERYIHGSCGKTWRKRPSRRPRHRWEDIRINAKEIWQEVWVGLIWIRTEKISLRVPQNKGNFFTRWETVSFSRRTVPWSQFVC
jgi:hypothetical protein